MAPRVFKRAQDYFEQALSIYRDYTEREYRKGEGWTLNNLGKIHADLGNTELALNYLHQALNIRKNVLRNRWEEGRTLRNLGEVYIMLGQKEEALRCLIEALSISREVGDRRGEGKALNGLGCLNNILGEREQALNYLQRALSIHREMGDRRQEAKTLGNLGILHTDLLEQPDSARKYYEDALSIYREVGDRWGEGRILENTGALYFKQNHYNVALAFSLLAKDLFEEIQTPDRDKVQEWIDSLHSRVGEEYFTTLLFQVEPQAHQIVEQALRDGPGRV